MKDRPSATRPAVDDRHYVPVLLTRQGERMALRELPDATKDRFTPLLVVHPVDPEWEDDEAPKTPSEHLKKLPKQLQQAWGKRRAFIDLLIFDDDSFIGANNEHPLVWLTRETKGLGLPLVPTVSPTRTQPYRAAVAAITARDGLGICLRLAIDEWPSSLGTGVIDALLSEVGASPATADLVLDLGIDVGTPLTLTAVRHELGSLPWSGAWRSITVAGAGIPAAFPPGRGVGVFERSWWIDYKTLRGGTERIPTFGDYAVANPSTTILDVAPKMLSLNARLRYTINESWLVSTGGLYKGSGGKSLGAAAVQPAAVDLAAHPSYTSAHCATEAWVASVLSGAQNGGAPATWRKYGTLHHLQFVTEQIASLP